MLKFLFSPTHCFVIILFVCFSCILLTDERFFVVSVGRLEERELELKKEYNSLHQRHSEVTWRQKNEEEEEGSMY